MKRYLKSIGLLFLVALISVSCSSKSGENKENSKKKKSHMPHTVGVTSELLVITNKVHWDGVMGDSIREFFGRDVPGMPQVEPVFTLPNVNMPSVHKKMFRRHRNIFIIEYKDSLKNPYLETKEDLWAAPQRVVKITTPDDAGFFKLFSEHKEALMILYHKNEIRRIQQTFKDGEDTKIRNRMMRKYDLSVTVPSGFFVARKFKDFFWLRKETPDKSQGMMMYIEEYKSRDQFKPENILMKRNTMTRKHIPGPTEGSYMITSKMIEPESKEITFKGKYCVMTRGLWEVENDFMGGPFLSYTFVDEKTNRLITLDSYAYHPGKAKRDLMLQMEAIMKSIVFEK
ncbi:MAG: DUF4837 family protein [Bacteroidota bacterium]|nr:DUF4837 family protein [Bacteroidota bacterium]